MRAHALALFLVVASVAALATSAAAQPPTTDILLVDDDWDYQYTHPGSQGGRPYYTSALEALGLEYEVWDVQTQGQPSAAALLERDAVIWFTGYAYGEFDGDPGVFTPQNENRVAAYLDGSGRFLLSSEEYYFGANDTITPFMSNYLGVQDISDVWVYTTTVGVTGNPVGDGIGPLTLTRPDDYGEYWPTGPFEGPWDAEVYPRPEAGTPFLYHTAPFPPSSTNFETELFKTVYLGWPFEWVDTVNQRALVLGSILSWMGFAWPVPEEPILSDIENADGDGWYQVDWSDCTGAILYMLEEADEPGFLEPVVRYLGPESSFSVASQPLGTWYYRVRASSPDGESAWSNVEQAEVAFTPPAAPTLEPIDNADGDGDYWVRWEPVPTGITYTLQEDGNSAFDSPELRYEGPDVELHVEGQPAGLWFYRVRATGAGGEGAWSNVQAAGVVPGAPQLAPIDNPDGDGQYVADWSDVVGASSYSLQEDDGAAFDSPVTRYSGPSSQYPLRNQPEGTWYYRVRASNMVGAGPWSNIESVTVWGEKRQVFLPLVVYR